MELKQIYDISGLKAQVWIKKGFRDKHLKVSQWVNLWCMW